MSKTLKLSIAALLIGFSGAAAAATNAGISVAVDGAGVAGNIAGQDNVAGYNTMGDSAFKSAEGISQVQQNNGANNAMQQGAAVAINKDDASVQKADLSLAVSANGVISGGNTSVVSNSKSGNAIGGDSFSSSTGINQVQQNNGNNNAMQQGTAVAMNEDTQDKPVIVAPPALGLAASVSLGNTAFTAGSQMANSIGGDAFKGAKGISQVQQNNGSNNTMQQGAAVAMNKNTANFNVALAATDLGAVVGLNTSLETNTSRSNTINGGAFCEASGLTQVQQNSGNNNAMQQTIAVSVNGKM